MAKIPESLDAKLTREETAKALTEAGYPTAKATLSTKASRGGGPPYQLWLAQALVQVGRRACLGAEPHERTAQVDIRIR